LRLPLVGALELAAVALVALLPGVSEQYFLLPIIFGSVLLPRWYWPYTACVTLFLLQSADNVQWLPQGTVPWNVVWIPALAWLLSDLLVAIVRGRGAILVSGRP